MPVRLSPGIRNWWGIITCRNVSTKAQHAILTRYSRSGKHMTPLCMYYQSSSLTQMPWYPQIPPALDDMTTPTNRFLYSPVVSNPFMPDAPKTVWLFCAYLCHQNIFWKEFQGSKVTTFPQLLRTNNQFLESSPKVAQVQTALAQARCLSWLSLQGMSYSRKGQVGSGAYPQRMTARSQLLLERRPFVPFTSRAPGVVTVGEILWRRTLGCCNAWYLVQSGQVQFGILFYIISLFHHISIKLWLANYKWLRKPQSQITSQILTGPEQAPDRGGNKG